MTAVINKQMTRGFVIFLDSRNALIVRINDTDGYEFTESGDTVRMLQFESFPALYYRIRICRG